MGLKAENGYMRSCGSEGRGWYMRSCGSEGRGWLYVELWVSTASLFNPYVSMLTNTWQRSVERVNDALSCPGEGQILYPGGGGGSTYPGGEAHLISSPSPPTPPPPLQD